jgi:hypothetical protein
MASGTLASTRHASQLGRVTNTAIYGRLFTAAALFLLGLWMIYAAFGGAER